ncbi:MAG: MipA/OmpV family protein [Moraxellaceae bacterium]
MRSRLLILLTSCLSAITPVWATAADSAAAEEPGLYLGLAWYHRDGPYIAQAATAIMPVGDYEGDRLLLRGDTFGMRLFTAGPVKFNAIVLNDLLSFTAEDAVTPSLQKLDDRRDSWNGGLEASWKITPQDTFRVAVMGDVMGRHKSTLESVHANHVFSIEKSYTQIVPRVTWTYFQEGFMDYYFGVGAAESARSGLEEYHPEAGSRLDLGLTIAQPLSRDIVLFADGAWKKFSRDMASSPLTDQRNYFELSAGVLYNVKSLF